jgi:hypothetical protein
MPIYEVTMRQRMVHTYEVEADNEDHAHELFRQSDEGDWDSDVEWNEVDVRLKPIALNYDSLPEEPQWVIDLATESRTEH